MIKGDKAVMTMTIMISANKKCGLAIKALQLNALFAALLTALLLFFPSISFAQELKQELKFVIQPILSAERTKAVYQPLAEYLTKKTGINVSIVTASNWMSYWETMKKANEYDIILDAAHFTDFRIKRLGYTVLVKIPDTVSYTLVTNDKNLVLDVKELTGRQIATASSPSLGGIRLAQMFPNPIRQPIIVETPDSIEAIDKVLNGDVTAAIIPTPLLNKYSELNPVITTAQVPHIAISVSSKISHKTRTAIKNALLFAADSEEGIKMLDAIKFPGFVNANPTIYAGQAKLLQGVWGYY